MEDLKHSENWRVFRIQSELVEGFETLNDIGRIIPYQSKIRTSFQLSMIYMRHVRYSCNTGGHSTSQCLSAPRNKSWRCSRTALYSGVFSPVISRPFPESFTAPDTEPFSPRLTLGGPEFRGISDVRRNRKKHSIAIPHH